MQAKTRKAKSKAGPSTASQPRRNSTQSPADAAELPIIHRHAAGIDCGSQEHYVAVPARLRAGGRATGAAL